MTYDLFYENYLNYNRDVRIAVGLEIDIDTNTKPVPPVPPVEIKPFRITANEDSTVTYNSYGMINPDFKYRIDGNGEYQLWDYSTINLPSGSYIEFIGDNDSPIGKPPGPPCGFSILGSVNLSGNIMSMMNDELTELPERCFGSLFYGSTGIVDAKDLLLPATTLSNECYYGMFLGCTSLTTAPELPATELATECYGNMFSGCSSLTSVTCLATDVSADGCISTWLAEITTTGTLYVDPSMTGATWNIPDTWTVQAIP